MGALTGQSGGRAIFPGDLQDRSPYRFCFERTEAGGIRILRAFGVSPQVEVPDQIDGTPVTEIGDYCFSDSPRAEMTHFEIPAYMRELSGAYVEGISLPDTVVRVGNLAFYNCTSLGALRAGAALMELGSDAFMNCFRLREIYLRCRIDEKSGLKQILSQRSADTHVIFESGGEVQGELFFPEYYEVHDEIGPAHIFSMNISGEGFRARQCFQDGVVQLSDYDEVFGRACAEESPRTLCRMALYRLRCPVSLMPEAERRYEDYVCGHEMAAVREIIEKRESGWLEFVLGHGFLSAEGRSEAARLAAERGWTEGVAALLLQRGDLRQGERYSLDGL